MLPGSWMLIALHSAGPIPSIPNESGNRPSAGTALHDCGLAPQTLIEAADNPRMHERLLVQMKIGKDDGLFGFEFRLSADSVEKLGVGSRLR
jgi:hypothetical protein